jgi:uncharacterized protein
MTDDLMRYDVLAQRALRGVVRFALEVAATETGLPGDHHFYIAFATRYPGVLMPEHLKDEHPEEMTIVFKRHYWDLQVGHDLFSVTMSFHQEPHRLTIPYEAITRFFDPVVNFGLAWPAPEIIDANDAEPPVPQDDDDSSAQIVSLDAFRKK